MKDLSGLLSPFSRGLARRLWFDEQWDKSKSSSEKGKKNYAIQQGELNVMLHATSDYLEDCSMKRAIPIHERARASHDKDFFPI